MTTGATATADDRRRREAIRWHEVLREWQEWAADADNRSEYGAVVRLNQLLRAMAPQPLRTRAELEPDEDSDRLVRGGDPTSLRSLNS